VEQNKWHKTRGTKQVAKKIDIKTECNRPFRKQRVINVRVTLKLVIKTGYVDV